VQAKLFYGLLAGMMVAACGGSSNTDRGKWPDAKKYEPTSSGTSSGDDDDEELIDDGTLKFDEEQAKILLKRGSVNAAMCSKTAKTPAGEGDITVTFDGKKGQIVDVDVGYFWTDAEPDAQSCIKKAFIGAYMPPFEGGNKEMVHTLTIPEPGESKEEK
jgi:hypothetical protein